MVILPQTISKDESYQEEDFCIIFDPPISAQLLLTELQENE
jgi:hypothetical protein